jgi:hypothetical protein
MMNELQGFLRWQFRRFVDAHWLFWAYFAGIAVFAIGYTMEPMITYLGVRVDILLMILGGVACVSYFGQLVISIQLEQYRSERDRVLRELERKE